MTNEEATLVLASRFNLDLATTLLHNLLANSKTKADAATIDLSGSLQFAKSSE